MTFLEKLEPGVKGFVLIDKPKGIPSFRCVSILRRITREKRVGFAGTLDPLASGLMIMAVGREYTKRLDEFAKLDKTYEVEIELGKVSDSYDADGVVTDYAFSGENSSSSKNMNNTFVSAVLDKNFIQAKVDDNFLGERDQVPPIFSAVHVNGKRAYELARSGKKVELKSRKVIFYEIKVLAYEWPLLSLKIHCSSGTYVRSFANDLGVLLGCGGYVKDLRRTKIGDFKIEDVIIGL